ncbi:LOW QUALITY PROTEIN: hypothetical protein CFC21_068442 [Triticum aestivum]|uniref:Uncharacterized protein n=2 Tax=Triticum aestivum TaxID=4565 RepID=A0A9R1H9W8_WHEAT|nr:LOW QUALITY PROTEIN: hypothetical protein CFC21_068442 [Triticum aestivum]
MPEGATALEIPTDRPAFYECFKSFGVPAAATAFRLVTPPTETRASRPERITIYMPPPPPEMVYFAKRFAYAYIAPLELPQSFELLPPGHGADATVRFRTPDDREAAMRRQPFELDGATVKLVHEGETSNCSRARNDYVAHVALHDYPVEQRTQKEIGANCGRFGFVREIDPACFAAPDLATVRVVLQLEDPREIPRHVRIRYHGGSTSVIPVEVVRLWDHAHSSDAHGQYVPLFQAPTAAA